MVALHPNRPRFMITIRAIRWGTSLGFAASFLAGTSTAATGLFEHGNWWRAQLALSTTVDSNPFLVSDREEKRFFFEDQDISGRGQSVQASLEAGVRLSRQGLSLKADLTQRTRESLGLLDENSIAWEGRWDWAVGSRWFGQLDFLRDRDLTPITELQLFKVNNEGSAAVFRSPRRRDLIRFDLNYQYHPSWRIRWGMTHLTTRFEPTDQPRYIHVTRAMEVQWIYQRHAEGPSAELWALTHSPTFSGPPLYLNQVPITTYRDVEARAVLNLDPGGHSRTGGYIGYLRRHYPALNTWTGGGMTGRVYWRWATTARTNLDCSAWRQRISLADLETPSIVETGLGMVGEWSPRGPWRFRMAGQWAQNLFDSPATEARLQRQDRSTDWEIDGRYQLQELVFVTLACGSLHRESTVSVASYGRFQVSAELRTQF